MTAIGLSFATARAEALPKLNANGITKISAVSATIRGNILDENGKPVANAVIALLRDGAATVKQIRSAANGSFVARVAPGRYTLTAMASGFSVVSLGNVEVDRAQEIAFRFNLVRTGNGNTLPERRADRSSAKWRLRSNQARRTIYQNTEGAGEVVQIETEQPSEESNFSPVLEGYAETYFASSANQDDGEYFGINFAAVQPVSEDLQIGFAGQTGVGEAAPQRLETVARYRVNDNHNLNFSVSAGKIGEVGFDREDARELGQLSFQALDEWRVKDNLILVVGFDYSRFVGASRADSIAPRFGVQFDANAKTRFSAAYTTQHEPRTWQQAADLEDSRILFRETNLDSYAVADKPQGKQVLMPKLRRFEVGVERVLDNSSSIEALAFFDATTNRGVSFVSFPLAAFADQQTDDFAGQADGSAIQNGNANGVRLVYSRRLNEVFSGSIGYAFGSGQQLSSDGIDTPENFFETAFFQSLAAELSANFSTGTNVKTVWRYQPSRAAFALDPFMGRIGVYDPSMSVLVTQKLPTWGLPIRAKLALDARNLLDVQSATANGDTTLKLNSARRVLRGGIAVRF